MSIKDMRTIIYSGLFHEDKNLTPEKVGELIDDFSDIKPLQKKLGEAMTEAFGRKKREKAGNSEGEDSLAEWNWDRLLNIAVGVMGMTPDEFWRLTPFELNTMVDGFLSKRVAENQ
jgi:uncharacterized phage protein (TIGR02216 family)